MTYENYLGFSREVLLEKMRQILPEKRLTHCLGVEKAARDLAKRYGADEEQAGLYHGEKAECAHRLRRLGPPELPGDLQGNARALQLLLRYPPAAGRISVWRLGAPERGAVSAIAETEGF